MITREDLFAEILDLQQRLEESRRIASNALTQLEHRNKRVIELVRETDDRKRALVKLEARIKDLERYNNNQVEQIERLRDKLAHRIAKTTKGE